jgi:hypothetical protein
VTKVFLLYRSYALTAFIAMAASVYIFTLVEWPFHVIIWTLSVFLVVTGLLRFTRAGELAARTYSFLTTSSSRREGAWRVVAYLGVLLAVVACAANVRTVQSLRNAEALVEKSHGLILRIELERPHQGDVMLDYHTEIVGRVELRADSGEDLTRQSEVRSELDHRGLELVAVVHPLATDAWWVQPPVKIDSDGSFQSLIYIGEQEFGKGEEFEIAAILVPRGNFEEGLRLRDIPMTYGSSSIIKVRRKM